MKKHTNKFQLDVENDMHDQISPLVGSQDKIDIDSICFDYDLSLSNDPFYSFVFSVIDGI